MKRKLSEEHKRKIGASETGEKHWNYGKHWSADVLEKFRISHLAPPEGEVKQCSKCYRILPITYFEKSYTKSGRHRAHCRSCKNMRMREYKHRNGIQRPMSDAKESTVYLGVHVAERALSKFFDHIERMPYGNKGFDFYCGKRFKIDVKSSCLHSGVNRNGYWKFQIKYNTIADYFLCLAFDNRENLEPLHVWLIPGVTISNKKTLNISDSEIAIRKWIKYERPVDKVETCCDLLRGIS
ncbi:MAG: NUMOD3 domain-containing DNA-binding protein [Lentisphaeria bacterium]|nr:NUMOD3 domain-containing DNA-binding protein [Lentisphaeria bacterium]